ncbi:MAG: glycosyl hydrolase 53 family protein [Fibrobacteres bacterium]|nr:glycosyl hydrolase 53 family protein [Fibrobacterota bacterium]
MFVFLRSLCLIAILPMAVSIHAENARGADVGWLSQMESEGRTFRDAQGKTGDLLAILKGEGVNSIRLRVWVKPATEWCGKDDVVKMATRASKMGFRIMIDFHYSDSWADPGKQTKPAAWQSHGMDQLKTDVANHTKEVLQALKTAGVTPEWVQVGNETNDGMLWEDGKASKSMANFAALVQSGSKAVKEVFPNAKVVVHVSNGFDNSLFRWIFDGLKSNGTQWDVVGMSVYPEPATWRSTESQVLANMKDMVSRYGKQVVISEVGMAMASADSGYALLKKLQADVASLTNGAGLGVFYWEPQAYGGWQGYLLGAFDDSGKPTKTMQAFRELSGVSLPARAQPKTSVVPRMEVEGYDPLGRLLP